MNREKRVIYLTGIGMGQLDTLTKEAADAIEASTCIMGAVRMTKAFEHMGKAVVPMYKPKEIEAYIASHFEHGTISIVLSGDTGFYSGAKKLLEVLSETEYHIRVLPGISSVAYMAAKLKISWEDARLISLHGTNANLVYEVTHHAKTAVLLGGTKSPKEVYKALMYYGLGSLTIHVGSNFSYENEHIVTKKIEELRVEELEGLTVMFIENPFPKNEVSAHIRDDEFIRGLVPMTKEEIRAISIAKLHLSRKAVFYDIGAGTGSIAVEAALQSGEISVYAIEKKEEAVLLIKANQHKFQTDNLTVIEGTAPEALVGLPAPTHAFIGGSSGNLREIVGCIKRKNEKVRIVLNAISLETLSEVMELVKDGILTEETLEVTQIAVSKSKSIGAYHMMCGENPIYIVSC